MSALTTHWPSSENEFSKNPILKDTIETIDSRSNESGGLDRDQDISALLGGRLSNILTLLRGPTWGSRMKTVYLLRHFKSSWKNKRLKDFDRPLNKRGRRAAEVMARHLAGNRINPAQILCSSSRRTRESLERMRPLFGAKVPTRFEKGIYEAKASTLLRKLRRLGDTDSVMIIGHSPGMEKLALLLAGSGDKAVRARLARKWRYPTGTLTVLTADVVKWSDLEARCARLVDFVRPKAIKFD